MDTTKLCIIWTIPLLVGMASTIVFVRFGNELGLIVTVAIMFPSVALWQVIIRGLPVEKRKRESRAVMIADAPVGNCPECAGHDATCEYCGGKGNIWWGDTSVTIPKEVGENRK